MRTGAKLSCLLLLIAALFAGQRGAVAAIGAENRVIRVGYPIQSGFTDVDEKGEYTGYTYEFLEEMAQYTGWNYEFVQLEGGMDETLMTMYDMLERGELDLMGGTLYSEAMEERYDYVTQSYGRSYTVLNVLAGNTNFTQEGLPGSKGLRVGAAARATERIQALEKFCQNNDVGYELTLYDSAQAVYDALYAGEVDAILDSDVSGEKGMRVIARFAPREYYFLTTKGNTDLVLQANSAILSIEDTDPLFSSTLYDKYFNTNQWKGLELSAAERRYVEESPVLRVGMHLDHPPFAFLDAQTGELRGISVSLLEYIAERTGLKFQWVVAQNEEELDRLVAERKVDLLADMSYDYRVARNQNISMTRPYLSAQYVMLLGQGVSEDSQAGERLALPRIFGSRYTGHYVGEVCWYDAVSQCVNAVNDGEADYTYVDSYVAQSYMNQPRYWNLRMIPQTYPPHRICIGLTRPCAPELLTILNKEILGMPEEDVQSIIYQNTVYHQDMTLAGFLRANPSMGVIMVAVPAGLVIAGLLVLLWVRVRASRRAAMDLKKHYQLYELSNERFFEYDMARDSLMLSAEKGGDSQRGTVIFVEDGGQRPESELLGEWKRQFVGGLLNHGDGTQDIQFRMAGGESRWIRVTSRTVRDNGGKTAYIIGKFTDIDQEIREKEALIDQAQRDGLTELYNSAACRKLISERLAALPPQESGVLFILDVDHFKEVNDRHGHYTGDMVLQKLAEILSGAFRDGDITGRLGGDEFVAYLESADARALLEKRCSELIRRAHAVDVNGGVERLTISLGAAVSRRGEDYDSLYRRADEALYEAKKSGRDRCHISY